MAKKKQRKPPPLARGDGLRPVMKPVPRRAWEPQEQQNHPTCRAVLKLLEEASQLIRERIGEAKPHPEVLAMALGYCFSTMRDRQGPFSHVAVRTLVQEAYRKGWRECEEYKRIRGG